MKFLIDNIFLVAMAIASGTMLLWPAIRGRAGGATSLDTLTATRLINDGALVLDVRENAEFAAGHLPNARHIPLSELDKRAGELPANKALLLCCATGQRSGKAAASLRKAGRDKVFNLEGGLQSWRQAGLPVVK